MTRSVVWFQIYFRGPCVTPNIPNRATHEDVDNHETKCARREDVRAMGARAVLVKGGHLLKRGGSRRDAGKVVPKASEPSEKAIDVLDSEGRITVFRDELIAAGEFHGSGCTLSAAIAACLGKGMNLEESVDAAKRFVTEAIRQSPAIGRGARPLYIDAGCLTRRG